MNNFQSENNGCQYENCGKPTFSKRVDGKKMWKLTCPQHEGQLVENEFSKEVRSDLESFTSRMKEDKAKEVVEIVVTVSDIDKQIQELLSKKQELIKIEEERIKAEEALKPIIISVLNLQEDYGNVIIQFNKMNDDIIGVLRSTRGRQYDHISETNKIPATSWNVFKNDISLLNERYNIEWKYKTSKLESEIDSFINEPDVNVDNNGKEFILTISRRRKVWAVSHLESKLPGSKVYNPTQEIKNYRINVPLSEAWRIASTLNDAVAFRYIETYTISDSSMKFIEEQIDARSKLDGAAQLADVENFPDLDLNGQTLRPFQKVGVRFACLALGLGDITK